MSARNNTNPNQFKLFYGGKELKDSLKDSTDMEWGEDMPKMWSRKLSQSKAPGSSGEHGSGVFDSISSEGYVGVPLVVAHEDYNGTHAPRLGNGHHRVAAAAHIEETTGKNVWIPVDNQSRTHFKLNGAPPPIPREKLPPTWMRDRLGS